MSQKYTISRPWSGKNTDELNLPSYEIRKMRKDTKFSNFFEQLLEKKANTLRINFIMI